MSYTIEYARQFIRSEEGITPCWLAGDNNVTEGRGKSERRVREWSCFNNFLGVTEDEIMATVKTWLGGYQEHWKRNGKWVDDKGLINWVKTGVRSAATIEEILQRNPACGGIVWCYAVLWNGFRRTLELSKYISTTADLDDWIRQCKALKERVSADEKSAVYPCIRFATEKIRNPIPKIDEAEFCLRRKKRYLVELTDRTASWGADIESALTFSYDEATSIIRGNILLCDASLVKAPSDECPRAVIRITEGDQAGKYVGYVSRKYLRTSTKETAYRYSSAKSARQMLKKILEKYPNIISAEVVTL